MRSWLGLLIVGRYEPRACSRTVAALLLAAFALTTAAAATADELAARRNFDARVGLSRSTSPVPDVDQLAEIDQLRLAFPDLAVSFDNRTGVTRTLFNRAGYLTGLDRTADAVSVAIRFVSGNSGLLGLTDGDLSDYELRSASFNQATGATHVYLRQRAHGLPLYNGQLHVNVNRDGRVISVNNAFLPNLATSVNTTRPLLSSDWAVQHAAAQIEISVDEMALPEARLMLLPIQQAEARLVWNFQLPTPDAQHYFDFTVDAVTGRVWTRFDWVADADYRVIPLVSTRRRLCALRPMPARTG